MDPKKSVHQQSVSFLTNAPTVTSLPANLLLPRRRDDVGYDTCGFRGDGSNTPLVCPEYYFCNTENTRSMIACCENAGTTSGHESYACLYQTACYDSTVAVSYGSPLATTYPASEGGDKLEELYCLDPASPYCNVLSLTDNDHTAFMCGSVSGVTIKVALTYSASTTADVTSVSENTPSSTLVVVVTSHITSFVTSIAGGPASTLSRPTGVDNGTFEQEESGSARQTGTIVGSVIGGLAAIGLVVAVILILRRKREEKIAKSSSPSLNMIGTNISPPIPRKGPTQNLDPAIPALQAMPHHAEAEEDIARAMSLPQGTTQIYRPYYRQPSEVTMFTSVRNTTMPHASDIPLSLLPRHYKSNSSIIPASEVDGISTPNSRGSTTASPDGRGSRFVELYYPYTSVGSRYAIDWDAQELP